MVNDQRDRHEALSSHRTGWFAKDGTARKGKEFVF